MAERRLRWFESWADADAFFSTLMASNYVPGLYGRPIRIGGYYYVDGAVVDNVPYEVPLEAGCDRVLVIVPDSRGHIRKQLMRHRPHEVPSSIRHRLVVIHPDAPLPIGRVRSTPEDVLRCIDAGHRAVDQALADRSDGTTSKAVLTQTRTRPHESNTRSLLRTEEVLPDGRRFFTQPKSREKVLNDQ